MSNCFSPYQMISIITFTHPYRYAYIFMFMVTFTMSELATPAPLHLLRKPEPALEQPGSY